MTRQELTSALRRTGLVHEDAIEDPEGWDGCVTEARIGRLHEELFGDAVMGDEMPWIGVDLDGTLAHYDEWRGIEHIGEPIGPMWRRVMGWLQEGKQVRILTARVGPQRHDVPHSIAEIRGHIEQWCLKHLGQVLPVTCQKDYNMVEFWDDRCVQVVPNEGVSMHEQYAQFAVELNQRLIERQESYLAQVVRIEGTWRERLRVAGKWLPIETAPKDGTPVDLWVAGEFPQREANAYWGKSDHCCGEMGQYCDSDWHGEEPGWRGYYDMPVTGKITHWMPIAGEPAAPEK